jgi:hypothetical protein
VGYLDEAVNRKGTACWVFAWGKFKIVD